MSSSSSLLTTTIRLPTLFTSKQHTKHIKTLLEKSNKLNKKYKIAEYDPYSSNIMIIIEDENNASSSDMMALPLISQQVLDVFEYHLRCRNSNHHNHHLSGTVDSELLQYTLALGYQEYKVISSSSKLSQQQQVVLTFESTFNSVLRQYWDAKKFGNELKILLKEFNGVKLSYLGDADNSRSVLKYCKFVNKEKPYLVNTKTFANRTLLLPHTIAELLLYHKALHSKSHKNGNEQLLKYHHLFYRILNMCYERESNSCTEESMIYNPESCEVVLQKYLEDLAKITQVRRIACNNAIGIDKESHIRKSHIQVIYTKGIEEDDMLVVTEHSVTLCYDITKTMFSRGNVTEKSRFGLELVQKDEVVLDMYAGIGYYTLPALLLGKAKYVYACEWNPDAVQALNFNLKFNKVHNKAEVFEGDCRISIKNNKLQGKADRISLGLLPSSEGGWEAAVGALNDRYGGWLHIHGNVMVHELENWIHWMCQEHILRYARSLGRDKWVVWCTHTEKVKSFAPKVNHYVADIYCGPKLEFFHSRYQSSRNYISSNLFNAMKKEEFDTKCGCIKDRNIFREFDKKVDPPSCALNSNGPISQKWMK